MSSSTLGQRTTKSMAWMLSSSVVNRGLQFLANIALAWFLTPDDFGLISLCYAASSFVIIFRHGGVGAVLTQHGDEIDEMAGSAGVSALITGLGTAVVMVGVAFGAAWWYAEPQLLGLLLVMAASMPLESLRVVPEVRLRYAMRFKALASVMVVHVFLNAAMSIVMAYMGYGAYSFVIPRLATQPVMLVMLFVMAGRTWTSWPRADYMRMLLGSGLMVSGGVIALQVMSQGDYLILGHHFSTAYVGVYYLAFSLSNQGIMLIANNVSSVFAAFMANLPAEGKARHNAFVKTLSLVSFLGAPLCLTLSGLSGPILGALFDPRWQDAALLMSILSAGMAVRVVGFCSTPYMEAQKRWRGWSAMMWVTAGVYVVGLLLSAPLGRVAMAWTVAGMLVVMSLVHIAVAMKSVPRGWAFYRDVFVAPLTSAAVAGYGPAWALRQTAWPAWAQLVVGLGCAGVVYLVLSWWINRPMVEELVRRARPMLDRRSPASAEASGDVSP